eukprot:16429050-Heterocapsa_arctica.AAC.1
MTAQVDCMSGQPLFWRLISYNAGRFSSKRSIGDILHELRGTVVALQGTGLAAEGLQDYSVSECEGYHLFQWPWKPGKFTNAHCGIAIALHARRFPRVSVTRIYTPPRDLLGRAGAL